MDNIASADIILVIAAILLFVLILYVKKRGFTLPEWFKWRSRYLGGRSEPIVYEVELVPEGDVEQPGEAEVDEVDEEVSLEEEVEQVQPSILPQPVSKKTTTIRLAPRRSQGETEYVEFEY